MIKHKQAVLINFFNRKFGNNLSNNMAEVRKKWLNLEISKVQRITSTQLIKFYLTCLKKYMAAVIEPGIFVIINSTYLQLNYANLTN